MCSASAAIVPYQDVGTEAVAHTFTADQTGNLTAYYAGSTAYYTETLGLYVNGKFRASDLFNDKTTAIGTAFDFGTVTAGDTLLFFIDVSTTGHTFWSDQSMNADGVNHVYSRSFVKDPSIGFSGTFVAFEDLYDGGDLNYNDETFVFTNTATAVAAPAVQTLSPVPLPASAPMFGAALLGLAGLGFVAKRKKPAATA